MTRQNLKICLIAGEPSGDVLGADLMRALRDQAKQSNISVSFIGTGGPQMQQEGLNSLFPIDDIAVMGIAEIVPRVRLILQRIRQTADVIKKESPDIIVTIDVPDFSFRVMKRLKKSASFHGRAFHYVAPTVWAWRPRRAKKVAALYDGILCLLPFEPPYFIRESMAARHIGHPSISRPVPAAQSAALRTALDIPPSARIIGFLPGSRHGELKRTGGVLRDALLLMGDDDANKDIHLLCVTLPHLEPAIRELAGGLPFPVHITTDPAQKWAAFGMMDAALATSGTIGLELAVAGVPHVIGYRMSRLTWRMIRFRLKTRFAHLANIILERQTVPEFIQNQCTPLHIAKEMHILVNRKAAAVAQKKDFAKMRGALHGENKNLSPSAQAAAFILSLD